MGLDPWESHTILLSGDRSITITATPARHGPAGIEKIAGDVIGFVQSVMDKKIKYEIYIIGDTAIQSHFRE